MRAGKVLTDDQFDCSNKSILLASGKDKETQGETNLQSLTSLENLVFSDFQGPHCIGTGLGYLQYLCESFIFDFLPPPAQSMIA